MKKLARLFLTFDMLGDLKRSGPIQWQIDRFRTSDIKDHVFDLISEIRLLKPYLPKYINTERMIDYAIVHDLAEVITGDITTFEGVSKEEKARVDKLATDYLIETYGDTGNIKNLLSSYERRDTIEAVTLHMLDKISSSIEFLKYDCESKVDMDNPEIIEPLRCNPGVVKLKEQGLSLGEIFYVWHLKSVVITDEELTKINKYRYKYSDELISREDADRIADVIKTFMEAIHDEISNLNEIKEDFPKDAMLYKHINDKRG